MVFMNMNHAVIMDYENKSWAGRLWNWFRGYV